VSCLCRGYGLIIVRRGENNFLSEITPIHGGIADLPVSTRLTVIRADHPQSAYWWDDI